MSARLVDSRSSKDWRAFCQRTLKDARNVYHELPLNAPITFQISNIKRVNEQKRAR